MRRLMMIAPVVALALSAVACSEGAFNSPTSPGVDLSASATEAKGGNGGGGKGGGGSTGGGGTTTPPPTGGGTLAVAMVTDADGNGRTSYRDTITFNVTSTVAQPYVKVNCYQGGVRVYSQAHGFYEGYLWTPNYLLASGAWVGGAADCTGTLYYTPDGGTSSVVIATLAFRAE